MQDRNPFQHLVMMDDLIVPLASLPSGYQQMVRKARVEGKDIAFNTDEIPCFSKEFSVPTYELYSSRY